MTLPSGGALPRRLRDRAMPASGVSGADARVPYAVLVEQFRAAPPGKLYCLHGSSAVFRMSLSAAAHALLHGIPMTLVDGTNRFDVYYLAEFARKFGGKQGPGHNITPEQLLQNIFVSRAFTCYQMEALVTERLPVFVRKKGSPIVIIFGLLDTFYDEQAPMFEVRSSMQRIIAALHRLKQANVSVLLASLDVRLASKERAALFPKLTAAMDRVYAVHEEGGRVRISLDVHQQGGCHGQNSSDVYNGDPAGDGKLVEVPARTPEG